MVTSMEVLIFILVVYNIFLGGQVIYREAILDCKPYNKSNVPKAWFEETFQSGESDYTPNICGVAIIKPTNGEKDYELVCNCIIVSERYVITTASCMERVRVLLQPTNLPLARILTQFTDNWWKEHEIEHEVATSVKHTEPENNFNTALLRIRQKVPISPNKTKILVASWKRIPKIIHNAQVFGYKRISPLHGTESEFVDMDVIMDNSCPLINATSSWTKSNPLTVTAQMNKRCGMMENYTEFRCMTEIEGVPVFVEDALVGMVTRSASCVENCAVNMPIVFAHFAKIIEWWQQNHLRGENLFSELYVQ